MRTTRSVVLVLVVGLGLVGCSGRATVDVAAEAEKIRALSRQWLAADVARDVEAAVAMYADDAVEFASNTPAVIGKDAIRAWYRTWLPDTTVSMTFATETVEVSESGDLGYERGTYRFRTNGPKGSSEDVGKYLTVWKRVGDTWKVAVDMANSDMPLPGA